MELGLDRVLAVARMLRLDLSASKVVVVGGTNGKGSTVAALQAIALSHGLSVASYTSPHLLRFNERIQIDGKPLDDEAICRAFEEVEKQRGGIRLTYFEFTTLAALVCFQYFRPHWCLLEVGLGGRLDAVNIIDADIALVSNIQLDHQGWLGEDREAIALEKAGIFRASIPAICSEQAPPEALRLAALSIGAQWMQAGETFTMTVSPRGWAWRGVGRKGERVELTGGRLPVLESSAVAGALQASLLLLDTPQAELLVDAVSTVTLPGRCQAIEAGAFKLVLDVAHNPAAGARLCADLRQRGCTGETHLILAMLMDKDGEAFCAALAPAIDGRWWLPQLPVSRAMPPAELAAFVPGRAGLPVADVEEALAQALSMMGDADRLVVAGSFHTVAETIQALGRRGLEFE